MCGMENIHGIVNEEGDREKEIEEIIGLQAVGQTNIVTHF